MIKAEGIGQDGSEAVFEPLPKTGDPVDPGHEPIADQVWRGKLEAPAGHWPGGFIHRGPKQLPTIELPLPLLQPANGAAEEAAGCWWNWPALEISYSRLRDLHSRIWIARVKYKAATLRELVQKSVISEAELAAFAAAYDFLWRIRNELHYQSKRKNDAWPSRA